jgi:V/A-type H+-transporting ATPase subunit C
LRKVSRIPPPGSAGIIYAATRLRLRRKALLTGPEYMRMLAMSMPQLVRFISERGYKDEFTLRPGHFPDTSEIEQLLMRSLSRSCADVRSILSGSFGTLTVWYLHRWDILNAMTLLRGKKQGLPPEMTAKVLVPAGEFDAAWLDHLNAADSYQAVMDRLAGWTLYPVVERECRTAAGDCLFLRLEHHLYQEYYARLAYSCRRYPVPGSDVFHAYIRREIDLINIRTLMRIRADGGSPDLISWMLEGGNVRTSQLLEAAGQRDQAAVVKLFMQSRLAPVLAETYRILFPGTKDCEGGTEYFCRRWGEQKVPGHELEMAIITARLRIKEAVAKTYPFSVLSALLYLERKRYEVANIRAIAVGRSEGVPEEEIREFLVLE